MLSSLGTSVQWQIRAVDGGYIIRSASDTTKYLGVATSGKTVQLVTVSESTIPTRCLWQITTATGGGCLIKSKYNSYYLCENSSTVLTISSTGTAGSEDYYKRVWRLATTSYYGNSSSNTKRELGSGFSISNLIVNIGATKAPTINLSPSNAIWASASDFSYTYQSGTSGCVSFSSTTGKATGSAVGIATIKAEHKVTARTYSFTVYVDRYTYELVNEYGFTNDNAVLIRGFYDRVDEKFPDASDVENAWRSSRLLGGIEYNNHSTAPMWFRVAGEVLSSSENESEHFTNTLGYSAAEYTQLKNAIENQYDIADEENKIDFAHMQISMAGRLAYYLDFDKPLADIGETFVGEDVSYLAGWLGDCVLPENDGTTAIGNDDYCADLDAENIYRLIISNESLVNAANSYYANLSSSRTRADVFASYISYNTAKNKVYNYLIDPTIQVLIDQAYADNNIVLANYYTSLLTDEQYHVDILIADYPDTYNFLCSLRDCLADVGDYCNE